MAVLALDLLDAADAGQMIAGLDLDDAVAALDQRRAAIGLAQHPTLDHAGTSRLGCGGGGNRAGGLGGRSRRRRGPDMALRLVTLELLDGLRDLPQLRAPPREPLLEPAPPPRHLRADRL